MARQRHRKRIGKQRQRLKKSMSYHGGIGENGMKNKQHGMRKHVVAAIVA